MKIEVGKSYWYYVKREIPFLSYPHPPKMVRADLVELGVDNHFLIQICPRSNVRELFEFSSLYKERPTEQYKLHLQEYIEEMEYELNKLKETLSNEN